MKPSSLSIKTWVYLDGRRMKHRAELHDRLAAAFGFPAYYGRNLDAVWDLLSTWHRPLRIYVSHTQELDNYGLGLLALLKELEKERYDLRVSFVADQPLPQGKADMLYSV